MKNLRGYKARMMDSEEIQLFCPANGDVSTPFSRPSGNLSVEGRTRPYFFHPRVPDQPLTSGLSTFSTLAESCTRVYQALAKASCLFPRSDTFNGEAAIAGRVPRESKGHQIELRGFTPRPRGRQASLKSPDSFVRAEKFR